MNRRAGRRETAEHLAQNAQPRLTAARVGIRGGARCAGAAGRDASARVAVSVSAKVPAHRPRAAVVRDRGEDLDPIVAIGDV